MGSPQAAEGPEVNCFSIEPLTHALHLHVFFRSVRWACSRCGIRFYEVRQEDLIHEARRLAASFAAGLETEARNDFANENFLAFRELIAIFSSNVSIFSEKMEISH